MSEPEKQFTFEEMQEVITKAKQYKQLLVEAVNKIECTGDLTSRHRCSNCKFKNKPEIKKLMEIEND